MLYQNLVNDFLQELRRVLKKSLCVTIVFITILLSSVSYVQADGDYSLSDLRNCASLYSYSGKNNAYFYGISNRTLYSSRVIPNRATRYITVSGSIYAACHDENYAYALYKTGNNSLGVVRMNMNSGKCDYCTINDTRSAQKSSFAVSGNEIFIIYTGSTYLYVKSYNFSGKYLRSYTFPNGAEILFCNGGIAYARAFSGAVFRLSGASQTKCADLEAYKGFTDAGPGYILLNDKRLVSLGNGRVQNLKSNFAVVSNKNSFYLSGSTLSFNGGKTEVSSPKLLCAADSTAAVLSNNFNCEIISAKSSASSGSQSAQSARLNISGNLIIGIEVNSTVAKIKEKYPEVKKIFNLDGKEITSGKLRTGYSALTQSGEYKFALRGDVNSSGTLNTADTDELMKALLGTANLSDCRNKAADYNYDGSVNTKDLILIGKMIN